MSKLRLRQGHLFGSNNQILFNASIPRRITLEEVALESGFGSTTVLNCLKGVGHSETIKSVKQAVEKLGYNKVQKYKSIRQEFVKGHDLAGKLIIDERPILILRRNGRSVRYISKISGIYEKRIKQILKKHGACVINLQTIKDSSGLSNGQNLVLKKLEKAKSLLTFDSEFKTRGSAIRQQTARILKQYKNGITITRAGRNLGIDKGKAFRCVEKTTAYRLMAGKRAKAVARINQTANCTFSKIYYDEKSMLSVVEEKLKEKFNDASINKEVAVVGTYYGNNISQIRADFVIERKSVKPVAVEVKHSTGSGAIKVLMGQIMIYKTCGYDVQCVFPVDVFISEFARIMLQRNNVTYWTV